jgi:Cys-rich protein (TIGR01571 family)
MSESWRKGLFECLGLPKMCLYATFCPPCVYGQNAIMEASKRPEASVLSAECCMCCCTAGCCLHLPCSLRTNIRLNHNIKGSPAKDCIEVYCCTPCAMAQHHLELQSRYAVPTTTAIIPSDNTDLLGGHQLMGDSIGSSSLASGRPDQAVMAR